MPTSRPSHLTWLANKIIELQPKNILDIGIGFGGKGSLFREYTDIWNERYHKKNWQTRLDGIEIFEEYITELHKFIYNNIYLGNAIEIIDSLYSKYDLIYIGDVIEHIEKQKAKIFIKKLQLKTKRLIIVTPKIVSKQGIVCENKYETHISQWTEEDFKEFKITKIENLIIAEWKEEKKVYYCEGMKFFGERLEKYYNYKKYDPKLDNNNLVFFEGLYFDIDYKIFEEHKGNKIVFWNGSDVSRLIKNNYRIEILKKFSDTLHLCHNKQLQEELKTVGIEAIVNPIFFGDITKYNKQYKYKEKLELYTVMHKGREIEYGENIIKNIAQRRKDFIFHIYGIKKENTENIIYHDEVSEEKMDEEIVKYQGCLRLNIHDGLSQTVIKSLMLGQYPIIRTKQFNIPYGITEKEIENLLDKIKCKKEPNLLIDSIKLNNYL